MKSQALPVLVFTKTQKFFVALGADQSYRISPKSENKSGSYGQKFFHIP
jgi:hypothetical protein